MWARAREWPKEEADGEGPPIVWFRPKSPEKFGTLQNKKEILFQDCNPKRLFDYCFDFLI